MGNHLLNRHSDKRFVIEEIAGQLGIKPSLVLFSPYAKLRDELDQLVDLGLIELIIEDGETKYFIGGR